MRADRGCDEKWTAHARARSRVIGRNPALIYLSHYDWKQREMTPDLAPGLWDLGAFLQRVTMAEQKQSEPKPKLEIPAHPAKSGDLDKQLNPAPHRCTCLGQNHENFRECLLWVNMLR